MRAMSLAMDEGESEQNEMRNLQEKLESTTRLVFTLSQQLNELKEQVSYGHWAREANKKWLAWNGPFSIHLLFMKRKRRKSLPLKRFGYVILIIIKFRELFPWISLTIINTLGNYTKQSKECFIRYPDDTKLVLKTRLRLVFQPFSYCLDIWWNTPPCVWFISSIIEEANMYYQISCLFFSATLLRFA